MTRSGYDALQAWLDARPTQKELDDWADGEWFRLEVERGGKKLPLLPPWASHAPDLTMVARYVAVVTETSPVASVAALRAVLGLSADWDGRLRRALLELGMWNSWQHPLKEE